jgi:outer membrane protein OmpA-like peptidoglycan-associated protein
MFVRQNAADPEHFTSNSAVVAKDFVEKASPLAAGVLLRLVWGKPPKKSKEEEAPAEILPEPVVEPTVEKEPETEEIAQVQESEAESEAEPEAEPATEEAPADKPVVQVQEPVVAPTVEEEPETEELAQVQEPESGDIAELESQVIPYEINQIQPAATAISVLDRKVTLMKKYPFIHLLLVGNTCDLGSHELNMRIGKQRAEAVRDYLVKHGIASERIQTISFGETRPLAPADKAHRKTNRRVEVVVIKL